MIDQRRFAPIGGRIKSESVAGYVGISTPILILFLKKQRKLLTGF
jgi:hypothetical protein